MSGGHKKEQERPDKNLTDNEIIKALKELLEIMCCEGDLQRTATISNTIDLINRLQAENKRLKTLLEQCEDSGEYWESKYKTLEAENERLKKAKYIFSTVDYCADDLEKALKENEELKSAINGFRGYEDKIKAEAYKEFAKRLMSYYAEFDEVNEIITLSNLEKAVKDCFKKIS